MQQIPSYALYGEAATDFAGEWLHCETIPARSRLHGYTIRPHRHGHLFQVLTLTAGSAEVTLDGTDITLHAPAAAVLPALCVHGYRFSRDVDGHVISLLDGVLHQQGLPQPRAFTCAGPQATPIIAAVTDLRARMAGPHDPLHDLSLRAQTSLLLVTLARAAASDFAPPRPAHNKAAAFRHLVEQNFRHDRAVGSYAAQLGISQTHLGRISRQHLGAAPLQIIEQRILLEARRNLVFTHRSIKQIADDLGYDDAAYFTRVLTRLLGMAPSAYRSIAAAATRRAPPA
ncbi:helix-turn-helix domain-containing protein [Ketogulonicigenium robustum]|nr:helix-turn-helix domain-containing protein [Ketogulonicigenium robustum]